MVNLYLFDYIEGIKIDPQSLTQEVNDYLEGFDHDRSSISALAYSKLLTLLKEEYQIEDLELIFKGKPHLKNQAVYFNISHTLNKVIIAISNQEVGVDIESATREFKSRQYEKLFSKGELRDLEKVNYDNLSLMTTWVKKEAYLKYLGKGITTSLSSFDTSNLDYLFLDQVDNFIIAVYSTDKNLKIIR